MSPRRWIAEWDWPSDAGSSVLSGEPARPISARQCTRVALLSSLVSRERPRITSHEQAAVHRLAEHGHVPRWALNSVVVAPIGCPLGCHASDLRSTDASASNVSSGHSVRHAAGSPHRTSAASAIALPPRRRCVHGRRGSPRCFCSAPDRGRTRGVAVGGESPSDAQDGHRPRTHNQPSDLRRRLNRRAAAPGPSCLTPAPHSLDHRYIAPLPLP